MPFSVNPLFVGREDELRALATDFVSATDTVAITGLGGIGRTELAIEFVHRYGQYFAGGVYWLSFADPSAVPLQVAACGGAGRMELRSDFGNLSLEDQVREVMSEWQGAVPRLLVFDDCEEQAELEQWRPPTGGCRVLVTSRRARWDPEFGIRTLPLNVLSRQESIALLREHRPDLPAEDQDLDAIVRELGNLPLALQLVGNYLSRYRFAVTPGDYLAQLRRLDLLRHPSLRKGRTSPTGHEQNIARTFALSYDQLDTNDPTDSLAGALLARAAFFAPGEPIPRALLRSTLELEENSETVLRAEDALGRLAELGLLGTQEDGALRLHRLLAAFSQERATDAEAQTAVEVALSGAVGKLMDERCLTPLHGLYPHLRAATEAAKKRDDKQAALLCNYLGSYLWMVGEYIEARPYLEQALTIRKKVLGEEHPETAKSVNNLALLLYAQGIYSSAHPLFERALKIRERELGDEHPETAESLNNLSTLLREQGEYEEARPLCERALEIREKVLGKEHPETAESLSNLGTLLIAQGAYAEARSYLERALEIREKVLGGNHPSTAVSLNRLAALLYEQGAYAEARSYLERALGIQEKVLGEEHLDTAKSLNTLALVLQAQGAYTEARSYLDRTLKIRERVKGEEHPLTALSLNNLAALLYEQGAYTEARSYLERTLKIYQSVFGEDHPLTAAVLNNLAMLLLKQGEYEEARPFFERTLKIQEKMLGSEHPDTAVSFNNLGTLLRKQAAYAEAHHYTKRALAIREKVLGPEHPDTAKILNNLALLLHAQGAYAEARPLFERALEIREKALGVEHLFTAESLIDLASLLQDQGEYTEARSLLERARAIREKVLGEEHP